MALDTLQLSPVVINNDKLVQMAGNLLAKKQAEEKAYENDLINRMAKIDSSGMKSIDVDDFKKMYDEYVNFGSTNLKNLNDPATQVKLRNMENNLRGFITQSKAAKEEDLKLIPYAANPDYAEESRSYINSFMNMKTKDRVSQALDYGKIMKIDDKDYLSEFYKGFKGDIIREIGDKTYKNTGEILPLLDKKAEGYLASNLTTKTGEKAVKQLAKTLGIEGTDTMSAAKVKEELKKNLINNFISTMDTSITQDESKKPTEFEIFTKTGFDYKLFPMVQSRHKLLNEVFKGDQTAVKEVLSFLPRGSKYKSDGFNLSIEVPYKDENDGTIKYDQFTVDRRKGGKHFVKELNKFVSKQGRDTGWGNVTWEMLDIYSDKSGYNPSYKSGSSMQGRAKSSLPNSGGGKPASSKPSGSQSKSLLGGTVVIRK